MRQLPIGAQPGPDGTHFRVWAPLCRRVEVVLEKGGGPFALEPERNGYFAGRAPGVGPGALYRFRLDGGEAFPDPASRFQPQGPHGPSQVVDPLAFEWTDARWPGVTRAGQVLYEMHVGTFTPEGTWQAARALLPELAALGVTVIEVMPIADFPGRFGWGYDGVCPFAPTRLYGSPDDLRAFVNEAHLAGLGVILDVVYNHFGPDGNTLPRYSSTYQTDRHVTDWGPAVNFDGEGSAPVREMAIANATYWMREYHLDGLRLDATQDIHDSSEPHILAEIGAAVREAARPRTALLVAENEPQHAKLVRAPADGGYGLDSLWNDDYHHSAMVALTGRREAYYTDYLGSPQELLSAVKHGYLYQGQRYRWQKQRRGAPALRLPRSAFVNFIQNHDQVANSARGLRVHALTSPGRYRALTALTLLAPGTPMLFQGQEFAASTPFLYFADHAPPLSDTVRAGRREFLAQFRSLALPEWDEGFADPADPATFARCVLDHGERERHAPAYALHRDLLRVRRSDPVLRAHTGLDGAVLGTQAFVLRYFGSAGDDRLLAVNLGPELLLDPAPEPLLAPPEAGPWRVLWSSESREYGGDGTPALDSDDNWRLPPEAAVLLEPSR